MKSGVAVAKVGLRNGKSFEVLIDYSGHSTHKEIREN